MWSTNNRLACWGWLNAGSIVTPRPAIVASLTPAAGPQARSPIRGALASSGIAFQVMDTGFACPQVAHRRLPAILPIFTMGKIPQFQLDQKSIFPLDRAA